MAAGSLSPLGGERRHWWISNKKMVERYVREAKMLMASKEPADVKAALGLLEAAPPMDVVLEMRARCLLSLRRFKEVADMLHESIPSFKSRGCDESPRSSLSSVELLPSDAAELNKCFSFSIKDLVKKVAGNKKNEGQWRYLVLGQACCHLGLLEDAMALLHTGRVLSAAENRRESVSLSDDVLFPLSSENCPPKMESDAISHLLCHIKLLLRRKTAAMAALDAGLHSEAIRHFSKILDARRGAPPAFLADCYVHRASAYHSAARIADAIADCNKSLALDPSCVQALILRASLFESIKCLPESLHDLEHLKLLFNSILRDGGPLWKPQAFDYREIPGKLCALASKIHFLKQKVAGGEIGNVDFYSLMGLKKNCSRSEVERSHLLLNLKHKPDKSSAFIERCEFSDGNAADSAADRANLSALLLYRLIQKAYANIMVEISDREAAEVESRRKKKALVSAAVESSKTAVTTASPTVFRGIFCRDLATVGDLLCSIEIRSIKLLI